VVKADVCAEAIRLTSLLAADTAGDTPQTHALLALMLLQAARLDVRTNALGELVLLEDQDRSLWNQQMLAHGLDQLARSAHGTELSTYHLEAGIAACHAVAPSFEATDWGRIVEQYDLLWERTHSPVVALNRAVAVAQLEGPCAAQQLLQATGVPALLADYYLYHATVGELARRRGDYAAAVASFNRALSLTANRAEQRLLERRIAAGRLWLEASPDAGLYEPA
jgi:RNA polymerase sigma-70 factor (ECF subfamily)